MTSMPLEDRLRAAAADVAARPVPDVSGAVVHRLRADAAAGRAGARRWRPALAGGLAALLLGIAVVVLVPSARIAVADFLGLPGVRVEVLPGRPAVGDGLRLGERVTLDRARAAVRFPVVVPAAFGAPDAVWLDAEAVPGGQVTLQWQPRAGLPPATPHDVGALLTVLPGTLDAGVLAKGVWDPDTTLTSVSVGDGVGWWVAGEPHALSYFDADGSVRTDRSRLAANTLLWQDGPVLYRLESALSLDAALRIARSIP